MRRLTSVERTVRTRTVLDVWYKITQYGRRLDHTVEETRDTRRQFQFDSPTLRNTLPAWFQR